jgi:hypothetical protein
MNWFGLGNSSVSSYPSTQPSRKEVPWVSPTQKNKVIEVPFHQATKDGNANFFRRVKEIEQEIKAKKS